MTVKRHVKEVIYLVTWCWKNTSRRLFTCWHDSEETRQGAYLPGDRTVKRHAKEVIYLVTRQGGYSLDDTSRRLFNWWHVKEVAHLEAWPWRGRAWLAPPHYSPPNTAAPRSQGGCGGRNAPRRSRGRSVWCAAEGNIRQTFITLQIQIFFLEHTLQDLHYIN